MPLRSKATIPQGMLAPSGYVQTNVQPVVQSTTRPAGTLIQPSPGYDSVRRGKNRFQGKGPTGGFRTMEFAEDVGGTGAALSVIPGNTSGITASEWIEPGGQASEEGAMIIADRGHPQDEGFARMLHEAYGTIPDMGDRSPDRPRSRGIWINPISAFRQEYRESPAITVAASIALVLLVKMVATDLERQYRSRSGGGLASEATAVPASGAATAGDVTADTIDKIGKAGDDVVNKIEEAGNAAVGAIEDAGREVKQTVTGE